MNLPVYFSISGKKIQQDLLSWYEKRGRKFQWRVEGHPGTDREGPILDPWLILVSETMLQQTQTTRVAELLPPFLTLFPTAEALANANSGDVLRAWKGMGYNSRALRLQNIAREIVGSFGGAFPSTIEELLLLKGIGLYTASAIACFAFGAQVPVVDINIERVYSRLFFKCHTSSQRIAKEMVDRVSLSIIPNGEAYRWHQGVMDLGATICTARRPKCLECPLQSDCLSAFPREIELFHPSTIKRPEPEVRGTPRRIWRGRIVELLRLHQQMRVAEILDSLPENHGAEPFRETERRVLLGIIGILRDEGLLEIRGVVKEGGIAETDLVELPG